MSTHIARPFSYKEGLEGISQKMASEHYKLYEGYVNKANEIEGRLSELDKNKGNVTYHDLRSHKLGLTFAINAIKSHEQYFDLLSDGASSYKDTLAEKLFTEHFGSFENWLTDMKATAMCARGWATTVYDWQSNKVYNHLSDAHDTGVTWNTTSIIPLDAYEHAYFMDYGVSRTDYIEAFFKNLNWNKVDELLKKTRIVNS